MRGEKECVGGGEFRKERIHLMHLGVQYGACVINSCGICMREKKTFDGIHI